MGREPLVPGLCALVSIAVAVLAGCGTGTAPPAPAAAHPRDGQAAYTAGQLRAALLPAVDGARPAAPVQAGPYGTLRGVRAMKASMRGMRIIPGRCARAADTGLDSAALATAPATVASFRHGRAGVSEILLAPPDRLAAKALGRPVPRVCTHYRALIGGRTYDYTIRAEPAPRLGAAAREMYVHASGAGTVDVWTVIYRATGYVGAITLVGTHATRRDLEAIARGAYGQAQRKLP